MTPDPETATFLIAGPVRIHPRVLRAMSLPSVNHRATTSTGSSTRSGSCSRSCSRRRGRR